MVALLLKFVVGRIGERRDRVADTLRRRGVDLQDMEGRQAPDLL